MVRKNGWKMKKSELRKIIKPIVEECVREVLLKEGTLSGIISEVVRGIGNPQPRQQIFTENIQHSPEPTEEENLAAQREIGEASKKKLQETRNKMMEAIGKDSYNGVNLFENTKPLRSAGNPGGQPTPPSALGDRDPSDAGVDISALVGSSSKKWSSLLK
jgi:hypothetical protein